jgi:hypothetical protein
LVRRFGGPRELFFMTPEVIDRPAARCQAGETEVDKGRDEDDD